MSELSIWIRRYGKTYGWTVFDGREVAASDFLPRFSRASARRAAERAASRYERDKESLGPLREHYKYPAKEVEKA